MSTAQAYLVISLDVRGIVRNCIGNAEVNEFQLTFDQNEVGRLKIRMYDLLVVDNLHSLKHLQKN